MARCYNAREINKKILNDAHNLISAATATCEEETRRRSVLYVRFKVIAAATCGGGGGDYLEAFTLRHGCVIDDGRIPACAASSHATALMLIGLHRPFLLLPFFRLWVACSTSLMVHLETACSNRQSQQ